MKRIIKDPTYNVYSQGGNVERAGKEITKDKLMKLADMEKIEFDVQQDLLQTLKDMYEKEKSKGQSFSDWLKNKPIDELKRIELNSGGSVAENMRT